MLTAAQCQLAGRSNMAIAGRVRDQQFPRPRGLRPELRSARLQDEAADARHPCRLGSVFGRTQAKVVGSDPKRIAQDQNLLGGEPIPSHGFGGVLDDAASKLLTASKSVLRAGMPLRGRATATNEPPRPRSCRLHGRPRRECRGCTAQTAPRAQLPDDTTARPRLGGEGKRTTQLVELQPVRLRQW
jgi:hypothetical protein